MKKLLLLLLVAAGLYAPLYAQNVPQGFNYQSIVRDVSGNPVANQTVSLLLTIRNGLPNGPVVYSEKQVVSTNEFGLINLVMGQGGTPLQGTFGGIDWGSAAKYLTVSVETSPNVFDELGSSQLMSVPYALYAKEAAATGVGDDWGDQTAQTNGTLTGNGTNSSPLGLAPQGATSGQVLKWNGTAWAPADDAAGAGGTVTQINTGAGLTGGPITTNGTISLSNTGVTPGAYGGANEIPVITLDAQGRVINVTTALVNTASVNAGAGINVQQNGSNYTVINTGDTDPSNDITTSSVADGDVTGPFDNLQIKANAVTNAEIADNAVTGAKIADNAVGTSEINNGAVTAAKLNDMGAANGQVLKWNGAAWAPQPDNAGVTLNLTAGSGISITGIVPNLTITNTGDTDASNDLTTTSQANGDIVGPFNNLQLKNDVVSSIELTDNAVETANINNGAVTAAKLNSMNAAGGQVLKWNGTTWAPAPDETGNVEVQAGPGIDIVQSNNIFVVSNGGDLNPFDDITINSQADGDISGTFGNLQIKPSVVTNAELANNAVQTANIANGAVTAAKLNNMSATNGQVLKFNGVAWAPGSDNDTGDNWGAQSASVSPRLNGNGTAGQPLDLAQQNATSGQVLKWNGTAWAPANDNNTGDNWGAQSASVSPRLNGNGTAGQPLDLAPQNATNGQVLKWNGTTWAPANDEVGTGAGDNWGSQVAVTNPTLTGNGTPGQPLGIAQQGAVNGQTLKWSGVASAWVPADAGDDWGSQTVSVEPTLDGNGTVFNKLKIAKQGAANGQVLKWNDAQNTWLPANDEVGAPGGGDNWGTQVAITNATISGNGTAGSPLAIAAQGATNGQVLKFNGTTWTPGPDNNTGDNWGSQSAAVGNALTGNGTAGTPLNLAQQGALNGQTLKWSGVAGAWVPADAGDDWGSQTVSVEATLAGNGTVANKLTIAQQGAATGQVLKWSGTTWAPANDETAAPGSGDNWGTQVAVTNATLSGDGTAGSPLAIAAQGAANGQVLKFNGTTWVPGPDNNTGDNWGAQAAVTNATLSGNGTAGSPLAIAAQGAANGQVLKFNGTTWAPSSDNSNNYAAGAGITITGLAPNFTINNAGDLSSTNELQTLSLNGNNLTLSQGGGTVTLPTANNYNAGPGISITGTAPNLTINNTGDADNNASNELQALSINGNDLTLSQGGGTVTLPSGNTYTAGTGISITGTAPNFTINNAGDADADPANELQTLSLAGPVLSISGSGSTVDFSPLLGGTPGGFWQTTGGPDIFNLNSGAVLIGANAPLNTARLQVQGTASDPAAFFAAAGGAALLTGDGNVGINTATPAARLDVAGDGRFRAGGAAPQLVVEHSGSDAARLVMRNAATTAGWQLIGGANGFAGEFSIERASGPGGAGAGNVRYLIANAGNQTLNFGADDGFSHLGINHYQKGEGFRMHNIGTDNNWEFWVNDTNGSLQLFFNGNPVGAFAPNGAYNASDRRLKKDIASLPGVLSKLLTLQPVSYRFNKENMGDTPSIGFVAQDVQTLFPELVKEMPARGEMPAYLSVNYAGIGVLAVRAIQEQQEQIQTLKQENADLTKRMSDLETRLNRLEKLLETENKR